MYLAFGMVYLAFGMVYLAGTIVTPALVTVPLIFELLRVNCRDLRTLILKHQLLLLTLTKFMPGVALLINEKCDYLIDEACKFAPRFK